MTDNDIQAMQKKLRIAIELQEKIEKVQYKIKVVTTAMERNSSGILNARSSSSYHFPYDDIIGEDSTDNEIITLGNWALKVLNHDLKNTKNNLPNFNNKKSRQFGGYRFSPKFYNCKESV